MKEKTRRWLEVAATIAVVAGVLWFFGVFGVLEEERRTTVDVIAFLLAVSFPPGRFRTGGRPLESVIENMGIRDWFFGSIFLGIVAGFVVGFFFAVWAKKTPMMTGAEQIKKQVKIMCKTAAIFAVLALPLSAWLEWDEYAGDVREHYPAFYEKTREYYPRALFLLPLPGGRD